LGCLAQPRCLIEHRVEHGREIAGRGIDDLQYLGGRGLLLRELIALGKGLIEPPLQLSVGTPKVGDFVIELGADSAAANARIVWEAKEKNGVTLRSALTEIDEARRNRQAQVGVFVFSSACAPEGLATLQRHGNDVIVVWDADDAAGPVVVHAAYSLARALAVRERRVDQSSHAAIAEIERSARAIEKQIGYLDDVRRWAETVKGHGEKISERSARMAEELQRDVDRLDAQVAALRTAEP